MSSVSSFICALFWLFPSILANITVQTEYGPIWSDIILTTRKGNDYLGFQGIPYAAPPVGSLRFRPPQKHEKWQEPRKANTLGSACYQTVPEDGIEMRGVFRSFNVSEDCLFVNVYTPDIHPRKLYPVLVYIHGGEFKKGSGNGFGAQNFMDSSPIVFVTMNYRLGVFGFLSSGDKLVPGNYGLKDQLAALKWVQANIRNFGGDPKRVTLMGQSTGANNVHAHTLSRASKGFFHRAVILSGSAISMWGYYSPKSHEAQHTFNLILQRTNCDKSDQNTSLSCLKKLSSHDLKQAEEYFLANGSIPFLFRTVIEPRTEPDAFLTDDPRELRYPNPKLPLWFGAVSAEALGFMASFIQGHSNENNLRPTLDECLPLSLHYQYWAQADKIPEFTQLLKKFYFKNTDVIVAKSDLPYLTRLFSDMLFQMPYVDVLMSYVGKAYAYYYDHLNDASQYYDVKSKIITSSLGNFTGAIHSDDLISFFGPHDPRLLVSPADQRISDQLIGYLKNFIYTGNPNGKTPMLPLWRPVSTKKGEYMHIKDGFHMSSGLTEDPHYMFYRSLPIPWREMPEVFTVPWLASFNNLAPPPFPVQHPIEPPPKDLRAFLTAFKLIFSFFF